MPKKAKSLAQAAFFVMPERQRQWNDERREWWKNWDGGRRPKTYLYPPLTFIQVDPEDPAMDEWRHRVPKL